MADTINVTSSSNQTCDAVNTSAYPFFMLVYSLVFLVGLILNGFIMKFHFCGAQQRASSSLKIYLKNLTAADFLLCLFLPLRITHYASSSVIIRQLYCSFGACAIFINMYASIIFMGYIAANRYLKIIQPSGTHILRKAKTAHIISIITWVFLLVPTVTYTILFFITQTPVTSNPSCCDPFFTPPAGCCRHSRGSWPPLAPRSLSSLAGTCWCWSASSVFALSPITWLVFPIVSCGAMTL
uniref:G-protein coupled receptors family 1 profile domain-containing protein n=1 Tax=Astatotilapia calliptera TaxID=8154 RepID=A0AAX7UMI5_ASTCA